MGLIAFTIRQSLRLQADVILGHFVGDGRPKLGKLVPKLPWLQPKAIEKWGNLWGKSSAARKTRSFLVLKTWSYTPNVLEFWCSQKEREVVLKRTYVSSYIYYIIYRFPLGNYDYNFNVLKSCFPHTYIYIFLIWEFWFAQMNHEIVA